MYEVKNAIHQRQSASLSGGLARSAGCAPAVLKDLDGGSRIVAANAGDHPLVQELLSRAFQSAMADDFQSRLDDPGYEPSDRLLLQRDGKLLGQVQLSKQMGWFQQQRCAVSKFQDFVVLPEFRRSMIADSLLQTAEEIAASEGSGLGLVRTDDPEWFHQNGWSQLRGGGHTQASTHGILSHLDAQEAIPRRKRPLVHIRTWRHFEADGLRRIYQQLTTNMWGSAQRSEPYWQWLLGRKAHDQILIAVKRDATSTKAPLVGQTPHIVGYAVVKDSAIVEMFNLPGYPAVPSLLVAQACRDAIDRDHRYVSLHTPAADPMHELFVTAGGSWIADSQGHGGVWMMKLLSPQRWVERIYPLLHARSRETGIRSSQQAVFSLGDAEYRLVLTRRSSRLEAEFTAEPDVRCDWHTFQDLLLSNLAIPNAISSGWIQPENDEVQRTLVALFPPKLFWQSPLELLRL